MRGFAILESGGADLAIAAAMNYRALREGHQLLHSDRDFDPFEERLGLQVVHADTRMR